MDYELFRKIKKGNANCLDALCSQYLKKSWFLCWHATLCSERAVPLIVSCWDKTIQKISAGKSPPKESFMALFSTELMHRYRLEIFRDEAFAEVPPPHVGKTYQLFADSIDTLEDELRVVWLVYSFGDLSSNGIANVLGIPMEKAKELIQQAASKQIDTIKKCRKMNSTQMITLSTKFKNPDGSGLSAIEVPRAVINSIEHIYRKHNDTVSKRKEPVQMNNERAKKKRSAKIRKWIITICILAALATTAVIVVPKLLRSLRSEETASAITTTYSVEAIQYGDVDTTISGSGTLSPIQSDILTAPYPEKEDSTESQSTEAGIEIAQSVASNTVQTETYEITKLNFSAGEAFSEGDVLAVLTNEDDETTEVKADYDGIVLEVTAEAGDEISSGDSYATIMSKDGFSMEISVDQTEIAAVEKGQEVTLTVDAVSETYTGSVSAVSYNGTSSGSTSTYPLTLQIEYADGIYPSMRASAEIVTESSGEGLLVPIEAVSTSGDDIYIYLAPDGAENGTEYAEEELTLSDLTKVSVETGMTDGKYILIESDQLSENDLIIVTKVTSTLTGSESSNENGGGFGGFGGMDFGNMDFGDMGDFDPSNLPNGGGQPNFNGMQQ
ncbi:MAG: HlyD family efflux transporter periplasmic adaptor subunit [Ruminococcus callidus]|nr:HlyD family efflux transporter periplasmic adaptor subunit [Ruminococcus callidus]